MLALRTLHLRGSETAAVVTAAALGFEARSAAASTATASRHFGAWSAAAMALALTATAALSGCRRATATIAVAIAATTSVAAAGPRTGRGCDCQRGDAGGKKHPGQHDKSPLERHKRSVRCTVPTLKRMELAD